MTPDQINATRPAPVYRCRVCRTDTGLSWFRGSSCPVCAKPECVRFCAEEWDRALEEDAP